MTKDVSVEFTNGTVGGKANCEVNFDADNGVLYLISDDGVAYVNFRHVVQVGIVPSEGA